MGQEEKKPLKEEFQLTIQVQALLGKLCIWEASAPNCYYACYLHSMQILNIWDQISKF